jgi:hypothetical protein
LIETQGYVLLENHVVAHASLGLVIPIESPSVSRPSVGDVRDVLRFGAGIAMRLGTLPELLPGTTCVKLSFVSLEPCKIHLSLLFKLNSSFKMRGTSDDSESPCQRRLHPSTVISLIVRHGAVGDIRILVGYRLLYCTTISRNAI